MKIIQILAAIAISLVASTALGQSSDVSALLRKADELDAQEQTDAAVHEPSPASNALHNHAPRNEAISLSGTVNRPRRRDDGAPIGFCLAVAPPERITAFVTQNGNAYKKGLTEDCDQNPALLEWGRRRRTAKGYDLPEERLDCISVYAQRLKCFCRQAPRGSSVTIRTLRHFRLKTDVDGSATAIRDFPIRLVDSTSKAPSG